LLAEIVEVEEIGISSMISFSMISFEIGSIDQFVSADVYSVEVLSR